MAVSCGRLSLFLLLALFLIPGATAGLYVVDVDLPPQNPVNNVVVTYTLPAGVIYKTDSFSVSGAVTSVPQEVVSTPNDGSVPVTMTWTFESVYNSGNLDIVIQFDGIVADVAGNQDGVQLPSGTVSYTYDGGPRAKTGRSDPTNIVEPDLTILKRRSVETPGEVTFELLVYHTPKSRSDAYDVVITDVLPHDMRYTPNSIRIISSPSGTAGVRGADLTWNFPLVDTSWKSGTEVKLQYKANKLQTSSSTTPRTLVWTSAAGTGYGEDRSYTLRFNETVMIVSILCSAKSVTVGKQITYTYTVTNIGDATVNGLVLTDSRLGLITLNRTSLATGQPATGSKSYTVKESDYPGPLVNTATATGTDAYGRSVSAVGTISVPFGTDPLEVTKTALNKTVARGGNVTYIIKIENNGKLGSIPPTNITVEDVFSRPVEILSASPEPAADGKWRFPKIDPGFSEKITLVVKVPEKQDINFSSKSSVTGEGFINAASFYTTSLDPFPLKNCVYVTFFNGTSQKNETVSDCETVTVGRAGAELSTREHGSGTYESDDLLLMETETDLISLEKDMAATHRVTTLTLPRNRTVTYSSPWTEEAMAKNRVTGASMSESYRYASTIDRESKFFLNENESAMAINAEFEGTAHIGFLKMPTNTSTFMATPVFESQEEYSGSFRIVERVDEYGPAASSEKSAEGSGLVVVDKRIGDVQRSYEHGTGSYHSEELIKTYTNYIAKEISLVYAPAEGTSLRWKEGISSKTPGTSLIGEEYTSITELDKETVARGLNEMETEANFSGRARYRTIYYDASTSGSENTSTNESNNRSASVSANSRVEPTIDLDEIYEGDYSIARKILISGAPRYDRPHLNVTKSLVGIADETFPGAKETTLAGESRDEVVKVATYAIGIENDGNRALGPVRVQDLFPSGAVYLGSSLRPTEQTAGSSNWTLTHLAIGDVVTIGVELDVSECTGPELTNRVVVCAGSGDEQICAANFSALEIDWLSWHSDEISAEKTGELGEAEEGRGDCNGWTLPRWDFERLGSDANLACELTPDEEDFWLGS
ncbi:MAG TPA: hypothetical protein PLX30_00740 [Methanothrix sp.]|nr:hypothetical protein [Methanothrix sp.]